MGENERSEDAECDKAQYIYSMNMASVHKPRFLLILVIEYGMEYEGGVRFHATNFMLLFY